MNIPDPTPEDEKRIDEIVRPYRKFINETPELLSLLYDIDLLPEQIRLPVNAIRLVAFCEVWKRSMGARMTMDEVTKAALDSYRDLVCRMERDAGFMQMRAYDAYRQAAKETEVVAKLRVAFDAWELSILRDGPQTASEPTTSVRSDK